MRTHCMYGCECVWRIFVLCTIQKSVCFLQCSYTLVQKLMHINILAFALTMLESRNEICFRKVCGVCIHVFVVRFFLCVILLLFFQCRHWIFILALPTNKIDFNFISRSFLSFKMMIYNRINYSYIYINSHRTSKVQCINVCVQSIREREKPLTNRELNLKYHCIML